MHISLAHGNTSLGVLAVFLTILGNPFHGLEAKEENATKLSELALAKREAQDFEKLAALIKPSVVVIESVDRVGREGGRGTGFVVSSDGIIATNFHVIGEHRDFSIRFSDGKSFRPVSILAIDRDRDLALIKIDAENLPVLKLDPIGAVQVLQLVLPPTMGHNTVSS